MKRSVAVAVALLATALAGTGTARASCGCAPRHVAHRVAHHRVRAASVATTRVATRASLRPVVDARGLVGHAQWDVEVIPGRHLAPLDTDPYLPTPGEPGFDARIPVSMGWGGVATPPLKLPVRRGYDGLK